MNDERYEILYLNGTCHIQDMEAEILTYYNDLGEYCSVKPVCDLLNEKEAI